MKNILYLLLFASLFLGGCEQNPIDTWEDDGRIGLYFFVNENETNESEPIEYVGEPIYELKLWTEFCHENFPADSAAAMAFYSQLVLQENRVPAYYPGESEDFVPDTVTLVVGYTGVPQDGFTYRLNAWPEEGEDGRVCPFVFAFDSLAPAGVSGSDVLYFEAGAVYDTVRMLMQPEEYGYYRFQVGFDSTAVQFAGIEEWNRWHLSVNYSYALDYGLDGFWPEKWFGEFSEDKHAFIQATIHVKFDQTFANAFPNCEAADVKKFIWQPLWDALEEYNQTHPDAPLTLPEESSLPI